MEKATVTWKQSGTKRWGVVKGSNESLSKICIKLKCPLKIRGNHLHIDIDERDKNKIIKLIGG